MVATHRLLTYEDLLDTPEDGQRYEIIEGELIVNPAPSWRHQELGAKLFLTTGNFVAAHGLGRVVAAPVNVRMSAHQIVQPDLVFIRAERLGIVKHPIVDGAPDLVVEILSPSTRNVDLGTKLERYAAAGIPEYWIADPENETFEILVLRNGRYEAMPEEDGKVRSVVLPGLVIEVAALFSDLVP